MVVHSGLTVAGRDRSGAAESWGVSEVRASVTIPTTEARGTSLSPLMNHSRNAIHQRR